MVRERVLIDLSHVSEQGLDETFAAARELDDGRSLPIASHAGYRFGRQRYMLAPPTVERIAERDGVVGLIFAQHQLTDGLRRQRTRKVEDSLEVLCRHIDRLREITGSYRHAAIGSDLDGFPKPTLAGLKSMADMAPLERALAERYGAGDAALICSDNALRLLRTIWH